MRWLQLVTTRGVQEMVKWNFELLEGGNEQKMIENRRGTKKNEKRFQRVSTAEGVEWTVRDEEPLQFETPQVLVLKRGISEGPRWSTDTRRGPK